MASIFTDTYVPGWAEGKLLYGLNGTIFLIVMANLSLIAPVFCIVLFAVSFCFSSSGIQPWECFKTVASKDKANEDAQNSLDVNGD